MDPTTRSSFSAVSAALLPLADAFCEAGDFSEEAFEAYVDAAEALVAPMGWTYGDYVDAQFSPTGE